MKEGFLYQGNDELENSMLRSILLFNNNKSSVKNSDLFLKALLSIITCGRGKYDLEKIQRILSSRFKVDYSQEDIVQQIAALKSRKLVEERPDGCYESLADREKDRRFIEDLESRTNDLIGDVIGQARRYLGRLTEAETDRMRGNVQRALSIYFQMYGYSFFDLKPEADPKGTADAVKAAKDKLPEKTGDALVGALAQIINEPDDPQAETLRAWARAYVAMQIINIDPLLRNFKAKSLKEKTFYIDTDVALYCLTQNARNSRAYRRMMEILNKIGCSICFPEELIPEIIDHLDAARKRYSFEHADLSSMTDEILENTISNIFVEDYAKTIRDDRSKRDLPFSIYIRNFYDSDAPELLIENIKDALGERIQICELDPLEGELEKKLADNLKFLTETSEKGVHRDKEKNERIARTDARIYLTIKRLNRDSNGRDRSLNEKVYLITATQKVIYSARELRIYDKNIICNPRALLSILMETGVLAEGEIDYVNLFENPFLAHTADMIWPEVEPLLKKGVDLKHADLRRLRTDRNKQLDGLLTCRTPEELTAEAHRLEKEGYEFVDRITELGDALLREKSEKTELQAENSRLKEQLDRREREKRLQRYQRRLPSGRPKKKK